MKFNVFNIFENLMKILPEVDIDINGESVTRSEVSVFTTPEGTSVWTLFRTHKKSLKRNSNRTFWKIFGEIETNNKLE